MLKVGIWEREEKIMLLFLCLGCFSYVFCVMCWLCIWLMEVENLLIVGWFVCWMVGEDVYYVVLCYVMVFYDFLLGVCMVYENRIIEG